MSHSNGMRGRPRHEAEVKRAPFNMTTTPELAARVAASAAAHGNRKTREVERLVRLALDIEASITLSDTQTIHGAPETGDLRS